MYIGNYSAVAVGATSVVVVVTVPVVASVVGTTSSTVGVVVSVTTGVVVSSVVSGLFKQPANKATPATRTTRVSNFFMVTHFII